MERISVANSFYEYLCVQIIFEDGATRNWTNTPMLHTRRYIFGTVAVVQSKPEGRAEPIWEISDKHRWRGNVVLSLLFSIDMSGGR
jgi:hypothetical protein